MVGACAKQTFQSNTDDLTSNRGWKFQTVVLNRSRSFYPIRVGDGVETKKSNKSVERYADNSSTTVPIINIRAYSTLKARSNVFTREFRQTFVSSNRTFEYPILLRRSQTIQICHLRLRTIWIFSVINHSSLEQLPPLVKRIVISNLFIFFCFPPYTFNLHSTAVLFVGTTRRICARLTVLRLSVNIRC